MSADDRPYWCLKEIPNKEINAGHLLSLTYTGKKGVVCDKKGEIYCMYIEILYIDSSQFYINLLILHSFSKKERIKKRPDTVFTN